MRPLRLRPLLQGVRATEHTMPASASSPLDSGTILFRPANASASFHRTSRLAIAQALLCAARSQGGESKHEKEHRGSRRIYTRMDESPTSNIGARRNTRDCPPPLLTVHKAVAWCKASMATIPTKPSWPPCRPDVPVIAARRQGTSLVLRFASPVPPTRVRLFRMVFEVEEKPADNKADAALTAIIDKIGVSTDAVKALNLEDFVGPITTYYHYNGSLTTPPCTEGVKWIVLDSHPSVKSKTLQLLRDKSSHVRKDNFRPYRSPQNRRVKKYTAI
ncbi:hypothetical protein MRX96_012053 [Rhipicephalus microplus]